MIKHKDAFEEKIVLEPQEGSPVGIEMISEAPNEGPSVLKNKPVVTGKKRELLWKQVQYNLYRLAEIQKRRNQ